MENSFLLLLPPPPPNRQKITALSPSPEPSDWSAVSINTDLYLGTIRSSVSNLIDRFQEELKRLYGKGETASQNGPKNTTESSNKCKWRKLLQNWQLSDADEGHHAAFFCNPKVIFVM